MINLLKKKYSDNVSGIFVNIYFYTLKKEHYFTENNQFKRFLMFCTFLMTKMHLFD